MTPVSDRLVSLDVCRGVAVAGMILVNNPGNWSTHVRVGSPTPSGTAARLADLVFPTFIFILGAAMPFAFARRPATRCAIAGVASPCCAAASG